MNNLRHDVQEALETGLKTMERLEFQRRLGMMDNIDFEDRVYTVALDTYKALNQAMRAYVPS